MNSGTNPVLSILVATALLASCGKDDGQVAAPVAVRVNSEEITVQQLRAELARLHGLNEPQRKVATAQLLDQVVDQALLVQRAIARELDRDPQVLQAIEASRRQILAQAYLDSITARAALPLPEDVARFYDLHPELFAERKIYRLQELAIAARPDLTTAQVEEELKQAKSLNEIVEWLRREKIDFDANSTVKAAEQLPMHIVPRLTELKLGQALLVPAQHGYLIVQLAAAEPQPLAEEQARPLIEQYLTNRKRRELAQAEVRTLRSKARIEYSAAFAGATVSVSSADTPAAVTGAPAAAAGQAADTLVPERTVKGI